MKGISTQMVILILMIIIGVALLYYAWTQGFIPWLTVVTESQCYTQVSSACSSAQATTPASWLAKVGPATAKCIKYLSDFNNCYNCGGGATGGLGTQDNCQACCQTDLPNWTPA